MARVRRDRTALHRSDLSKPVRLALEHGVLREEYSVLDYGCGRGGDVRRLGRLGFTVRGWDPAHFPDGVRIESDVVNLGFVLNVIEDPRERADVLRDAWRLTNRALVIGVRGRDDERRAEMESYSDGYVSSRHTFQKFFSQGELADWVEQVTGDRPVAAAPGIFFLFRLERDQQDYLLLRYGPARIRDRRPASLIHYENHKDGLDQLVAFVDRERRIPFPREIEHGDVLGDEFGSLRRAFQVARRALGLDLSTPKRSRMRDRFEQHRTILLPLVSFIERHGRLPEDLDDEDIAPVVSAFGSLGHALRVVKGVFGDGWFEEALERVRDDFLVYLALSRFGRRPKYSALPAPIQRDIRAVFGSYRRACEDADELLFSVSDLTRLSKAATETHHARTAAGLVVPVAEVDELPAALRVYEGCANAVIGDIEGAVAVRLSTRTPEVVYIVSSSGASTKPFPSIEAVIRVRLRGARVLARHYVGRPDQLVALDKRSLGIGDEGEVAKQERFRERLTAMGVRMPASLFERQSVIAGRLSAAGVGHRGHQVLRTRHDRSMSPPRRTL